MWLRGIVYLGGIVSTIRTWDTPPILRFLASIVDENEGWNGSLWSAGLVVVRSRMVDELALCRPWVPCDGLPLGTPLANPISTSLLHLSSFFSAFLSFSLCLSLFLSLSQIVAIISILLRHYNSSENVHSFRTRLPRQFSSIFRFLL